LQSNEFGWLLSCHNFLIGPAADRLGRGRALRVSEYMPTMSGKRKGRIVLPPARSAKAITIKMPNGNSAS
jgi:hypothetical protein